MGNGMRDRESMAETAPQVVPSLADLPATPLLPKQVQRFTRESLQAKPVRRFDPRETLSELWASDGKVVIAADIGGDKLSSGYFTVKDGVVRRTGDLLTRHGDGGDGYVDALAELSDLARRHVLPVGLSFAGPTDGTRLLDGPNLGHFVSELRSRYGGDFANAFPQVQVANDAEAGMMAGALAAARRYPDAREVIYVINGSGLGGAVLTGDVIYATEPGHVEVVAELNPFGQRKECGLGGARHVCVEAVAASKAGVEDIWRQQTGRHLAGERISALYESGNRLAFDLYSSSAFLTAHVIGGMADAFGFVKDVGQLVIVGHGGIFYVHGYRERVNAQLANAFRADPQILYTRDFAVNACLEGAAVAALVPVG